MPFFVPQLFSQHILTWGYHVKRERKWQQKLCKSGMEISTVTEIGSNSANNSKSEDVFNLEGNQKDLNSLQNKNKFISSNDDFLILSF